MSRIAACFQSLAKASRKGLVPYLCAGDPSPALTVPLMHALARAGADVIELGVPFSDPMADGPVIQRAAARAIAQGVGLRHVLDMVAAFRQDDAQTPVVLMGYANPIERMGVDRFVQAAANAGVDGVLVVDYPLQECEYFAQALRDRKMDPIFLLAPTTTPTRAARIVAAASGYVYYVSLRGITGAAHLDAASVAASVAALKDKTNVPIAVGFGIRDAASAQAVARAADAVVIGSRLIEVIEDAPPEQAAQAAYAWLKPVREALDAPHADE